MKSKAARWGGLVVSIQGPKPRALNTDEPKALICGYLFSAFWRVSPARAHTVYAALGLFGYWQPVARVVQFLLELLLFGGSHPGLVARGRLIF
jgi:hypothetical protein